MQVFARLKSIVLAVQNHYEGASAVPALPALPKTNEDAMYSMATHLGWEGRSNNSEEAHAEVDFAPAQPELLKHQIYAFKCLSRNLYVPKQVQESLFRSTYPFLCQHHTISRTGISAGPACQVLRSLNMISSLSQTD